MTTENGLPKLSTIRDHADVLITRMAYLRARIEQRAAEGVPDTSGFDLAELAALGFALSLIEAEWDDVARMHREHIMPADGRTPSATWTYSAARAPTVEQLLANLEQSVVAAREARARHRGVTVPRSDTPL